MYKLTICHNCKTKFKHDKNQERKYCSQSCSTIVRNKLRAKPKEIKIRKPSRERLLWKEYWKVKLHKFPFKVITRDEYQTMDYINTYQRFERIIK